VTRARRMVFAATGATFVTALVLVGQPAAQPSLPQASNGSGDPALVGRGRGLFVEGCASCHGQDAGGIKGRGPTLKGAGAQSADFYLRTGRMPLDQPGDQPVRKRPAYDGPDIRALVAYVGSLGGPPIPRVDPAKGNLSKGQHLFTEYCAGCHQIMGQGGIVTKARVPQLQDVDPVTVAEAVRVGPYLMPPFDPDHIRQDDVNSIVRYVQYTNDPDDRGGWGIGHLGPFPEGMVTWFVAAFALLLVTRIIGDRTTP
jgi:ubiquinol-cytochrome c reductase cytochrome c subunit